MRGRRETKLLIPCQKLLIVARYAFGVACLFAAATWIADTRIAAAVTVSFVAGYLNQFYVVRSLITLSKGLRPSSLEMLLAVCAIVLSVAIISYGFWLVLALATGLYLIVDALILRFRR